MEDGEIKLFIFCFNTLLVMLYSLSLASCTIAYHYTKKKQYLYQLLVFLLFIIDVSIVHIAEFFRISDFSLVTQAAITCPMAKTIVSAAIIGLYLGILLSMLHISWEKFHFLLIGLFLLLECFILMFPQSVLQVWCFYSLRQAYLLGYSLYYFYFTRKNKNYSQQHNLYRYNGFFYMAVVFGILILLEDTLVIPNLTVKEAYFPYLNERNISEEVFSIFLSVLAILQAYAQIKPSAALGNAVSPLKITEFPVIENDSYLKKVQIFCEHYGLTKREREILELLITDHSNQEISAALYISIGTVKTHVHNIYQKTGSGRKNELIRMFQNFEE